MNTSEVAVLTSRQYSSLLRRFDILDKLFQSKQLSFTCRRRPSRTGAGPPPPRACRTSTGSSAHGRSARSPTASSGEPTAATRRCRRPCNVPWYLDRALTRTNNFVSFTVGDLPAGARRDRRRPPRRRADRLERRRRALHGDLRLQPGRGHEYFDIDDPIYGKSHLTVADFSSNYQGSGTWTHTYFTKSYFKLPIKIFYPKEPILRRIWEVRPLLELKQADLARDRPARAGPRRPGLARHRASGLLARARFVAQAIDAPGLSASGDPRLRDWPGRRRAPSSTSPKRTSRASCRCRRLRTTSRRSRVASLKR